MGFTRCAFVFFLIAIFFLAGCVQPNNLSSPSLMCAEDWVCSDFGPCLFGTQSRVCVDSSFCGTILDKPIEKLPCGDVIPNSPGSIRVIRDTWGVANVISDTDEGALFGQGFATAEDRMFQMHYVRRLMQGRLSELIGNKGEGSNSTLEHDKKFRHLQYYSYAQIKAGMLAPETRKLLQAYANGVNAYLRQRPDKLNPLFEGAVPEPWTIADVLVSWDYMQLPGIDPSEAVLLQQFEQYSAQLNSSKAAAQRLREQGPNYIIDNSVAAVQQSDVPLFTQDAVRAYAAAHPSFEQVQGIAVHAEPIPPLDSYKWSQGWAVGGARSTTGNSILFGRPQIVVKNPNLWYEIHVQGKTFNARGIGMPGAPGFFVGFTPNVAWTMTAMGTDMSDLIRLPMETPTTYRMADGMVFSISVENQVIGIKGDTPVSITVKDSPIGPIVTPLVPSAKPGEEYVARTVLHWEQNHHTIESLIAMMRAPNVFAFEDAVKYYRTPSVNMVFSDSSGNVGYWAMAGQVTRSSFSPLPGRMAIDGRDSKNDWVEITPAKIRPHVINPAAGVSFSANHLPVGSWYPITDAYTGGETNRSWRLREILENPNKPFFSPGDIFNISLDTVDPFKRAAVASAIQARKVQRYRFSPDAESALDYLEKWYARGADGKMETPEDVVAIFVPAMFRQNNAGPLIERYGPAGGGLSRFLKDMERRIAHDPARATFDGPELNWLEYALSSTWTNVNRAMGSDPAKWVQNYRNGPAVLKLPYMSSLWEDYGSLNPALDREVGGFHSNGSSLNGVYQNAYSQWVNFADVDSSQAIQTPSISEHPDSIGYSNQIPLWVNSQLRPAPLSEEKVVQYKATEYFVN